MTVAATRSALADLAEAVVRIDYATLPADVRAEARRRVYDSLGSLRAGQATEDTAAIRRLNARLGPSPSIEDRLRLAVCAARMTECDDINVIGNVTAGSVVVPVAAVLADAWRDRVDDGAFLAAVVAGYEVMVRLAIATDGAHELYKGLWPTVSTGTVASAAITAKLLGLDADRTINALSIALLRETRPGGMSNRGVTPRWLLLGQAVADGYVCAQAAAAGFGGDLGTFAEYAKNLGVPFDESAVTGDLGTGWRTLDMDTKPFVAGRQGLAALDAFMQTPSRGPLEEIETIEIWIAEQLRSWVEGRTSPGAPPAGVRAQLAIAKCRPDRLYDVRRPGPLTEAEVALARKVAPVMSDPELTAAFPAHWCARVRTTWKGGASEIVEIRDAVGSSYRRFDWPELRAKQGRIFAESGIVHAAALADRLRDACATLGEATEARVAAGFLGMTTSA